MNYHKFLQKFYVSLLFYSSTFIAFYLFIILTDQTFLFQQKNLLNADAAHYEYIKTYGYEGFRTAFFPLFPFLWKLLNVGPLTIALINGFIFTVSISVIAFYYDVNVKIQLLLLSVPSLFFMFIPYTEALFFLFGTLIIIGLNRNNTSLITAGLLLSSMVRPSAYVFIPAIIITEYLTKESLAAFFKRTVVYSFVILLGLFFTVLIHYYYTNKWFVFFEAQKGWDNQLRIPHLPLTSWAGDNIVRLDGTALLVGIIAMYSILKLIKQKISTNVSKSLLFSLLYLIGISLIVLLFRGGSLFSLNRFIYASPYFILCFLYFFKNEKIKIPKGYVLFILFSLFWLLFGSYVHIQTLAKYELLSVVILLPFLMKSTNKNIRSIAYYSFLSISILLQVYFMYRFLGNQWIG
jgi:hypothetical protein